MKLRHGTTALAAAATLAPISATLSAMPKLSRAEQKIVRYADDHNAEALALLRRAVDINSGTMNFEGVRRVAELFRAELEHLGFETRWVDGAAFGRAGQLLGTRTARAGGAAPLRVLLIGHLDTVFEKDSPFQRFEALPNGHARGPGVIDMKGGDVVMLQALKALEAAGALDRIRVTVYLAGDEEKSGHPLSLARQALVEAASHSDYALGFEDGPGRPELAVVARRGDTNWTLRTTGHPAHSSQIFQDDVGAGAIYEAARILDGFYRHMSGQKFLTFSPGVVVGGTSVEYDPSESRGSAFGKDNVVADSAAVEGDLRTISPEQLASAEKQMQQIVADHLPHTGAALAFQDGYPPMAPTPGNQKLLALYSRASEDLGLGPVAAGDPMKAGAADIAFASPHVKAALDGIGLMGTDDHTEKETADLRTLPSQTKRAALLLLRLARVHQ
jgi:glutamate carboxypeptidase